MSKFNTAEFVRSHGRQPRGEGSWAFHVVTRNRGTGREDRETVFSPCMRFADAKKWVRAHHGRDAVEFVVGS